MTNFNHQLHDLNGKPSEQGEIQQEDNKVIQQKITILRCAKFSLLDLAKTTDGMENELNSPQTMYKRYKLWNKINEKPEAVELSKEEKELLCSLLPYRWEVWVVGQIMDLL